MTRLVLSYIVRKGPTDLLKLAFIALVTACATYGFQMASLALLTEGG